MTEILISAKTLSLSTINKNKQGILTSRNPLAGIVRSQPTDGSIISKKTCGEVKLRDSLGNVKTFSREVYLKTLNTVIKYERNSDGQVNGAQVLLGLENTTKTLVINRVSSKPRIIQFQDAEIMNPNGSFFTDEEKKTN